VLAASEVIDVSIPKLGDSSLYDMSNSVQTYIQQLHLQNGTFSFDFYAVSLKYLIADLRDILFCKFEFPWLDPKYKKRIDRYFICILFQCIEDIGRLATTKTVDPIPPMSLFLEGLYDSLMLLINLIYSKSIIKDVLSNKLPPSLKEFYNLHLDLRKRVTKTEEKGVIKEYREYLVYVKNILNELITSVRSMSRSESRIKQLLGIYQKLSRDHTTYHVGGKKSRKPRVY